MPRKITYLFSIKVVIQKLSVFLNVYSFLAFTANHKANNIRVLAKQPQSLQNNIFFHKTKIFRIIEKKWFNFNGIMPKLFFLIYLGVL
jgi:hypothetical protein